MVEGQSKRPHNYGYDFVRVMAMLMVVAVHAIPYAPGRWGPWYDSVMRVLLFPSNAIFFLLSGLLNIRVMDDDRLPTYYYRKFTRVLLPVLVYMFIRTAWTAHTHNDLVGLVPLFKKFVINAIGEYSSGEYWFIYSLFGMLMIAPLVAPAFVDMSKGRKRAFFILYFLFLTPHLLLCRTSHSFAWSFQLGGFFGCFLFGAVIDLDRLASLSWWKVALPTLCCLWISAVLLHAGYGHHPINDYTPMYYLAGWGMAALLYMVGQRIGKSRLLGFVAKHSFGVYLCHLPLMSLVSPFVPELPYPLVHLVLTIFTAVVALAFAAAVDTVMVNPLQIGADALYNRVRDGK